MWMFTARVKSINEETHNLMELRDLEDLIINNMGEDTWNAIMYFHECKLEELKKSYEYSESDIKDYDISVSALRSGITDELEYVKKIIAYIKETKRINKLMLVEELKGVIRRLEDNEGYI